MPKSFADELGARLSSIEARLNALQRNRLDHSALDGTTLWLKDSEGNVAGRLGRQADGSYGAHVVKVQPPPQLTAAILTVGEQAGTCLVEWDGGTFDGRRMPLIHGHTEVWAELVGDDWSPTVAPGDAAKRVGTIRDRTGGEVVVALPQAGTWAVWLRAMGADRETAGPWSPVATVEIKPLVDTEAIEAELEDARDRIEQAEQELAAGMADRKAEIDYLREERIPALQDALTTGLDDVYREAQQYAESQADNAVNQAAANAQSEYDRLQEIAERALSRAGDNVLEDPSFETDYWVDEWNGQAGRLVRHTTWSRTGSNGLVVGGGGATDLLLGESNVEFGQSYRAQFWYRTDNTNADLSGGTRLRILDADTGVEVAASDVLDRNSTGQWRRVQVTYVVTDDVESIQLALHATHPSGSLVIDDIAFQEVGAAAEALRLAEVARQQAEAAHIAAGNAVDAAANAYDAASSKSTVHWSLSAPSGTGNAGDVWWQYELRNGRRVVIGQWFWDNGVWRETEIAEEWLPVVNIGTGTYGDLSGDRLRANTIETRHLLVGPTNLVADTRFESLGDSDSMAWGQSDPEWYPLPTATPPSARISSSDAEADTNLALWFGGGAFDDGAIPCQPGETFRVGFTLTGYFNGSTSSDDYRLQIRWKDQEGNNLTWSRRDFGDASLWETVDLVAEVPEGAASFNWRVYKAGSAGGARAVGAPFAYKMTDSDLLVDGAVKSRSVDTEEFFAAEAVIQKIWTEIVRARMVETEGLITEDMIATGAITTPKLTVTEEMVAEVAKFLRIEAGSLASNDIEAMRIVSSLIEATTYLIHNADGDVSVRLDGMNNFLRGSLHAGVVDGSEVHLDYGIKSRRSGDLDEGEPEGTYTYETPYIELRTANHDYPNDAYPSIQVDGPDAPVSPGQMVISPGYPAGTPPYRGRLNVGGDVAANQIRARNSISSNEGFWINTGSSNQPGGIMRAVGEPRTRIRGRLPGFAAGDEMIAHGSTSSYVISNYTRGSVTFTPTPTGTRRPQVSAHVANNNQGYNDWRTADVASAAQSSSGFSWIMRANSDNSGAVEVWIYWTALWV